jgi:hypothetical protein
MTLAIAAAVTLSFAVTAEAIIPTPTVPLLTVPSDITVPEDAGKVTLTITKDAPAWDYSEVWVNTSDVGQSAVAGRDFTALSHNVDFDNKETSRTFTLTILNRHGTAGNRSFTVKFKSQRYANLSAPTMTVNITSVAPPPPATTWISAPLRDGGFAKVAAVSDVDWDLTATTSGRPLVAGEAVALYSGAAGYDWQGDLTYSIYALQDGTQGEVKASHLSGVAPVGILPTLPADWWVPGLVTANQTCTNLYHPDRPGVTQGSTYHARMLAGGRMSIAAGQTGIPGQAWVVSGAGDQTYIATESVVDGACLTGQTAVQ